MQLLAEGGRIGRFATVGGLSIFTYYALLYGLTEWAHVWYIASAVVAFMGYYAVNFLSQKYWTFGNRDRQALRRQLAQFTVMACGNWIINTVLLYLMVEYLDMYYLYAQVLLTIFVSVIAYFCLRYIFRPT